MPSLVEISSVVVKKIFKISLMYFRYYAITLLSPLGKGRGPTCLNKLQPRMLSAELEFGLVVLKKIFFKIRQYIFTLSLLSPLRKERAPLIEQS